MSDSEVTNGVVGYDFEDKETRSQLELIDDLQKLGVSGLIHLPKLIVVGDQSTGKSSVLQAVTEIPFPVKDKLCTRFATEVVLMRTAPNSPTKIDISIIPDPEESPVRKAELLAWKPKGFDETANLTKAVLGKVFRQAEEAIFGKSSKENSFTVGQTVSRLSSSILSITRQGPKETNFAIVDIPGLIRENKANKEHRTATYLIEKYLNNLRSIVMVVIDIVDLERQEIFTMLNGLPNEESRVIGVINKCDTKQSQSDDWVFELIQNNPSTSQRYLKEGWYGLRNLQPREIGASNLERDILEEKFFASDDWRDLDQEKLGRHQLKRALIKMRNKHIRRSIPELLPEIQNKLDKCIAQSNQLGDPRSTNEAQFMLINRIATKYSRMADGALNGQYNDLTNDRLFARKLIRDDLDKFHENMVAKGLKRQFTTDTEDARAIANMPEHEWAERIMELPTYTWIRDTIYRYRGNEDAGDVNPEVKNVLWKQQIASWNEIATEALSKIQQTVDAVNAAFFKEACPDEELRTKLLAWLHDDSVKASEAAKNELQRLVSDELDAQLFTLHPAKIEKQHWYRQMRIHAITKQCRVDRPETNLPQAAKPPSNVNQVSADLIINMIIYGNPDLASVLNTHDSLAAHYVVAQYRFIDNFALQVIERHLLGSCSPLRLFTSDYVSQRLYGEKNAAELHDLASEDPGKAKERLDLDAAKASLEEAKKRVLNFKIH